MSYLQKIEYRIVPEESFRVKHNCGGCGCKRSFVNTGRFRVNANGSRLDVWLIYQCEQCKHTLNMTIYERTRPDRIPKEEYLRFLANDEELAEEYGRNMGLFRRSRLEVEQEVVAYRLETGQGKVACQEEVEWEDAEHQQEIVTCQTEIAQSAVAYRLEVEKKLTKRARLESAMNEASDIPVCNATELLIEEVVGDVQILLHNPYGLKLRPERLVAQFLGLSRSKVKREQERGHLEILQKGGMIEILVKGESANVSN